MASNLASVTISSNRQRFLATIQSMNNMKSIKKDLSPKQRDELLAALKVRFDANKARRPGLVWAKVQARLF